MVVQEGCLSMGGDEKITSKQLMAIMFSILIGIGVLTLPRTVTEAVGPDGWLLILAGGVIVIITAMAISKLGLMFPGKTVVEYAKDIAGKPLGIILSLGLFFHLMASCIFQSRVLAEVTKQFLLDKTPTEIITVTILLSCSYPIRQDIATLGRMSEMMVPVFVVPSFLFLLPGIPKMDVTNLLPIMRTPPLKFIAGLGTIVTSYLGFETLFLFQPMMSRPKDTKRAMVLSLFAVTLIYMLVTVVAISLFGEVQMRRLIWPSFSIYRTIEVPGAFIENIHGVIMAIWVVEVYTTLSLFFFAAVTILSRLLSLKEHSFMVLPLVFFVYFLALMPDDISQVYESLDMISMYFGVPMGFILPFVLLIIAKMRNLGEKGSALPEKSSSKQRRCGLGGDKNDEKPIEKDR